MDAVLLTGGRAERLGGVVKPLLLVGGVPMAERAAEAARMAGAARIVVVGPDSAIPAATVVTQEDPPGSGPVAALAAGLVHVTSAEVAVLATDLPFLTAEALVTVHAALVAAPAAAAAMAVDGDGRDQPLLAIWRSPGLRAAVASLGAPANRSMRALVDAAAGPVLRVAGLGEPSAPAAPWFDCDTPADLARARAIGEGWDPGA